MRHFILACLLALPALAVAADWDKAGFEERYGEIYEIEAAGAFCREVVQSTADVELLRQVQDKWRELDPDGARAYFRARQEREPDSALCAYLRGRLSEEPLDAIRWGREALRLDGKAAEGYHLLVSSYNKHIFQEDQPQPEILKAFAEDEGVFRAFAAATENSEEALRHLLNYQLHKVDTSGARATFSRAKAAGAQWAGDREAARIEAHAGDPAAAERLIGEFIDGLVTAGRVAAADRDGYVNHYVESALRDAGRYETLLALQRGREVPAAARAEHLYNLACTEALMGSLDAAAASLLAAVEAGYSNVEHLGSDDDLTKLHDHSAWAEIGAAGGRPGRWHRPGGAGLVATQRGRRRTRSRGSEGTGVDPGFLGHLVRTLPHGHARPGSLDQECHARGRAGLFGERLGEEPGGRQGLPEAERLRHGAALRHG